MLVNTLFTLLMFATVTYCTMYLLNIINTYGNY